jgi:hypothetical protein
MEKTYRILILASVAQGAFMASSAAQTPRILDSGSYMTRAAKAALPAMCATGQGYPTQWTWSAADTAKVAVSAVAGTPQIDQYRGGTLIASYANFSGGRHRLAEPRAGGRLRLRAVHPGAFLAAMGAG